MKTNSQNPLADDLEHILEHTPDVWEDLRDQRIFITGGTGFFGAWLLESFTWANERLSLGTKAVLLTRDPKAFARKAPHLAENPAIDFWEGDIRSFEFPRGEFSHIIHAAANSANAMLYKDQPLEMLETLISGTRHALDFARYCGAEKFLLTSSGAVYGKQPPEMAAITEDYPGAPDPLNESSVYGQGKRMAEHLCILYGRQFGLQVKIARCFAFIGPYLPLNVHFAAGNFIRDGLKGGPIVVKGDGTPVRSYLYAADLAIWLWTILVKGNACIPYNVGSSQPLTIAELARSVASLFHPEPEVKIANSPEQGKLSERYIPSTQRAQLEMGLWQSLSLEEALERTIHWHKLIKELSSQKAG
jgi:dTDP-glucose 4,6-dehydratase